MPDAKICGITTVEALDAAIEGGARFVGFVTYPKSPRFLSMDKLAALAARARGRVETVLVTVNADDGHLAAANVAAQPDWIQLHGSENTKRAAEVRPFARRGLIKAVGIAKHEDFATLPPYYPIVDFFLFDAQVPKGGLPGGNALPFDQRPMQSRAHAVTLDPSPAKTGASLPVSSIISSPSVLP